ncbi:MAG: DNA primase [Mycoplasmatota bacterium]|nr:DNA primase [Mycoplasmatota bacterium]
MNITNEMINEIRNKIDIVDIISNYVPLTQRGKNYFGVCPFHDDHSPSMSVSKDKQIFKCFSCGTSGNVFEFVANYEHIGFYDAVKLLGNKVGYNLGTLTTTKNKEDKSYEIYQLACKFYQNNLNTSLGKNAYEYLENRKIDKDTIKKFQIGLSVPKISLTNYLLNKGIKLKELVDLGISNENGIDLFINRIMFPLYDLEGNVIAFSGRIYNTKDNSKYINTKETKIFKKGTILYNYHQAKSPLKKNENIIVMEGFMDVIRASTVGISNCVATMGTALTKQNATLLKKMADNIILCFDGDKAGEEATTSAINVLKEIDVNPKVVRLEENLDPDEYILKYGQEKFQNKLNNPLSSIEFLMKLHKEDKNLSDVEDISKYIDESIKDLISIEDPILVELTINKMAKEFNLDLKILKDKYNNLKKQHTNKRQQSTITIKKEEKLNQCDSASLILLFYMLKDEKIIHTVENRITFFPNPNIRALSNEMIDYYHKYHTLNEADFISYIYEKPEILKLFKEIINLKCREKYTDEEIEDYIKLINSYPVKNKIDVLYKKIKEETDPLKQASILSEILSLKGVK